ncbi:hypothetical protein ACFV9C_41680 [Kribbella sp. NPDC059898]|uniref:hypothetical protein n=1 Tax=Kribbella sp. NPDC059898 TaxID=3346995 RepID=UPI0036521154
MKSFFTKAATDWRHSTGKLQVYVVAPPEVRKLAALYQEAMAPFEQKLVSLQPLDHLHFTVQMIERHYPQDLDTAGLRSLAAELVGELASVAPFDLTVDFVRVGAHGLTFPGGRSPAHGPGLRRRREMGSVLWC